MDYDVTSCDGWGRSPRKVTTVCFCKCSHTAYERHTWIKDVLLDSPEIGKWHKSVIWRHNIYLQSYCNPHSVHKSSVWNINKMCWRIGMCFIMLSHCWLAYENHSPRLPGNNNALACAHTYSLQQYMIYISDVLQTQPSTTAAFVDSVRIYCFRMTPVEHRHKGSLNAVL